jgi:DNA-binding MarR family transcriptional regulator
VVDKLNADDLRAYFALLSAAELLQKAVAVQLKEFGLTPVQFSILARLLEAPEGMRMSDLADSVVVSRSGLTYQVGLLVDTGLLLRSGSTYEAGGVVASISDAGREKVGAAFPSHVALVRENFLDLVDTEALASLRSTLEAVSTKLGGPIAP